VEAIKFKFDKKEDKTQKMGDMKEIKEKLKEFNFKDKIIKRLLEKHTQEYLRTNIAIVEERKKK